MKKQIKKLLIRLEQDEEQLRHRAIAAKHSGDNDYGSYCEGMRYQTIMIAARIRGLMREEQENGK